MDELIPTINKLQDVFNVLREDPIGLPQIAVIGSQSSGKSSVLESFVGRDFLPRGTGIVTRRPLVLQLVNLPKVSSDICKSGIEWGEFLHLPAEKFYDFLKIREEIEKETERLTGKNKGISSKPIHLKICSENVLNLTLVDLPGITKIPVGDQPENIEQQVVELVLSYIKKENVIILAVTAANTDIANSDALKLAKKVDPDGSRTIGVCTKLDLMDAGTDALDILTGRVVTVKLGFIGVVNRSQKDINDRVSMKEAKEKEKQYFYSHPIYSAIADCSGTVFLAKTLNKILLQHIKKCLPEIKKSLHMQIQVTQNKLNLYGDPLLERVDKGGLLLQLLSKFAFDYCSLIDGTSKDLSTSELNGGARISFIFHEMFGQALENLDALEELSFNEISTALRNATGARKALFVPEICFELLVKRQIQRLLAPSLRCCELVYEELQAICEQCMTEEIKRFEYLSQQLSESVCSLLRIRLEPTSKLIENLMGMELAYINTNHPNFVFVVSQLFSKFQSNESQSPVNESFSSNKSTSQNLDNTSKEKENRLIPSTFSYEQPLLLDPLPSDNTNKQQICGLRNDTNKTTQTLSERESLSKDSSLNPPVRTPKTKGTKVDRRGWFNSFFGKNQSCEEFHASKDNGNYKASLNITNRQQVETEIIKTLIYSYFDIVRKNIQDSVPKAIMFLLVNNIKENIQSHLISTLYHPSKFDSLMRENSAIAEKRRELNFLLEALQRASRIINKV